MLSSLFKTSLFRLFPGQKPSEISVSSGTALRGERFSFQFLFEYDNKLEHGVRIQLDSPLKNCLQVRKIDCVPVVTMSNIPPLAEDPDIEMRSPGLAPDILRPVRENNYRPEPWQWNALMITAEIPEDQLPGEYPVTIRLVREDETAAEGTFTLSVLPTVLPKQKLIHTCWFHADCLAVHYKVPMWSEEHWKLLENFMRAAVRTGVNLLLTPVLTPPLDTAVGGERPTTQLLQITRTHGKWSFDFSRLERWIDLAKKAGIERFEIAHLFTQWGAACTPKAEVNDDGVMKKMFGWNVAGTDPEYRNFLRAMLPELTKFLESRVPKENVYFHCSDEPFIPHLEAYREAFEFLQGFLHGYPVIDALSHLEIYQAIPKMIPIPHITDVEKFTDVPEVWTYYCCGARDRVCNRLLSMPSSRNRILGMLLYRRNVRGFLQWGFNFYYSGLSLFPINPFERADAGGFFPAGDAFQVYPGEDGNALDSIHSLVFFEALQDMRLLEKLEEYYPREELCRLLDEASPNGEMTMREYPRGEENVLALRSRLHDLLKRKI